MGISRIGHVSFTVPDLERSTAFAQECMGLKLVGRTDEVSYLSSNPRHHQLKLRAGSRAAVDSIAFDAPTKADVDSVAAKARAAGLEVVPTTEDAEFIGYGVRFAAPAGPVIEVMTGVANDNPVDRYSTIAPVRPRKLGHVTISTDDCPAVEQVCAEVLGMRLSDRLSLEGFADGDLTWYRCNADHHTIGITPGAPGLHHHAWELPDLGSFGPLADHLNERGVRYIWGPGRHGPGDNVFAYFEDPAGSMVEVYTEMAQIHDEDSYRPREDWGGVEKSGNLWGPLPNGEAWFQYATPFESLTPATLTNLQEA